VATAVAVKPALLAWAARRGRRDDASLAEKFDHYREWLAGERVPSLSELTKFAEYTHTPFGLLFLPEPPDEPLPVPDFRTMADGGPPDRPSANLLDTIYACQLRQSWYREYAVRQGFKSLPFVGSCTTRSDIHTVAEDVAAHLGFAVAQRDKLATREDTRQFLIHACEELGVLVSATSVVGTNNTRRLDPQEFRGFALADAVAPLIFVNGQDTRAAQIFTLVHELAHIWAGQSALSDASPWAVSAHDSERWANRVAAEVLAPRAALQSEYSGTLDGTELDRLAKRFKVSTLVVLTSLHDAGWVDWTRYRELYDAERARLLAILATRQRTGGSAYNALPIRVGGRHFVWAVVTDTLGGDTLYKDAYSLLGIASHATFETLAKKVIA